MCHVDGLEKLRGSADETGDETGDEAGEISGLIDCRLSGVEIGDFGEE